MLEYREVPAAELEHIDWLVDQAKGITRIESRRSWEVVRHLFGFWASWYPEEYAGFAQGQKLVQRGANNKHAKMEGKMEMRHLLNIPPRFMKLLTHFFPDHNFHNKKFARELAKKMPIFKVPEKV